MKSSLKAILLAVPFIGGYYLMRSLPVSPCDFLHEETYNADGAVDYCGPGDSLFVDLSLRKWPLTLDFRSPNELHPGQSGGGASGAPWWAPALAHSWMWHMRKKSRFREIYVW